MGTENRRISTDSDEQRDHPPDLAKDGARKPRLDTRDVDLRAIVERVLSLTRAGAERQRVALILDMEDDFPARILLNPGAFEEALRRLVGTAIHFCPPETTVVLTLATREDFVWISVRAPGASIAPEEMNRLFGPLYKTDGTGTAPPLAAVRETMQAHGGRIWVENVAGEGATFSLLLPPMPAQAMIPLSHATTSAPNAGGLEEVTTSVLQSHRIQVLVVDANPLHRRMAQRMLESKAMVVTLAGSGEEALELVAGNAFDFILMDVQLPGMSGYQATQAICWHNAQRGITTPVVGMSASCGERLRQQGRAAGMAGYLCKPLRIAETMQVLQEVAASRDEGLCQATTDMFSRTPDLEAVLRQVDGDVSLLKEIATLFLNQARSLTERIRRALLQHDGRRLEQAAHSLKGSLGCFRTGLALHKAATLERCGREGDFVTAEAVWKDLEREMDEILQTVSSWIEERSMC